MRSVNKATPARLGYRMPAEWEPHAATWISWPRREGGSFAGGFSRVLPSWRALVAALIESEPVCINVRDAAHEREARLILRGLPRKNIRFHRLPTDEVWCRDYGPMFVTRKSGRKRLAIVDWDYWQDGLWPRFDLDNAIPRKIAQLLRLPLFSGGLNLEGGAVDVNGQGALLIAAGCFRTRRPRVSRRTIAERLRAYLGVKDVFWLGEGIAGDYAHGHIDTLARFVAPEKIVAVIERNRYDVNYQALQDNLARLRRIRIDQRRVEVMTLPLPAKIVRRGLRLPATYANFYVANSCVLVPTFADPHDAEALALLGSCFPERRIVGLNSRALIWGLGGLHCLTQQQPA